MGMNKFRNITTVIVRRTLLGCGVNHGKDTCFEPAISDIDGDKVFSVHRLVQKFKKVPEMTGETSEEEFGGFLRDHSAEVERGDRLFDAPTLISLVQ